MSDSYKNVGPPEIRVMEEAAEVIQAVSKCVRFGWDGRYPETGETNPDAAVRELRGMLEAWNDLAAEHGLPPALVSHRPGPWVGVHQLIAAREACEAIVHVLEVAGSSALPVRLGDEDAFGHAQATFRRVLGIARRGAGRS